MTKYRDHTIYRAVLRGIRIEVFGQVQRLEWTPTIEIYQARMTPELWRSRPAHPFEPLRWRANSADALKQLIDVDFDEVLKPWTVWTYDQLGTRRPTLLRYIDDASKRTG